MAWEIEVTDEFREWWADLTTDQQAAVRVRVELLGESGPSLGRPAVERIRTSRHHSMKELRSSEGGALRVLFMFDPRRQVILLLGGDKKRAMEPVVRVGRSRCRQALRRLPRRVA